MRGGCAWTTLHKAALLFVPTEVSDSQSSHKHSLTHLCVLVFLHSCHILFLLCPHILCSNSWEDTGTEGPFDRLHLAHLSTLKPKKWHHKDRKSFSPLGHFQKKSLSEKTSLSRKFHFSYSRALQLMLSCHPKSCSSFTGGTPCWHLELASELRWLDKHTANNSSLGLSENPGLLPLSAKRYCYYYCTKVWSNLVPAKDFAR